MLGHCKLVQLIQVYVLCMLFTPCLGGEDHLLHIYLAKKNVHLLRPVKDILDLKVQDIYYIPCECGKVFWSRQPSESRQGVKSMHDTYALAARQVSSGWEQQQGRSPYHLQEYDGIGQNSRLHRLCSVRGHWNMATSQQLQYRHGIHSRNSHQHILTK
jgi:hypothetical protein